MVTRAAVFGNLLGACTQTFISKLRIIVNEA